MKTTNISAYQPGDRASTFCGTMTTIAPEVYSHKLYYYEVDFWSLGVMIFEMLTSSLLFIGRSAPSIYYYY